MVAGSSYTGFYSPDGSLNIVINDGSSYKGLYHPCGALNAVVTSTANSYCSPNGSIYVLNTGSGYVLANPYNISSLPLYVGQIATGCIISNAYVGVANDFATRSPHIARSSTNQIKIVIANFCLDATVGVSQTINQASYSPRTFYAAFETAAGVITPFTFSGSTNHTAASGEYFVETDFINVSLTEGDTFFIRIGQSSAGGNILFWNTRAQGAFNLLPNYAAGEQALYGGPAISMVTSAANTWAGSGGTYNYNDVTYGVTNRPFAIVGQTIKPSVAFVGDSRAVGAADDWDASGDIGEIARTVGQRYGYICAARSGIPASTLSDPLKLAPSVIIPKLAQYCSHLIDEIGGADCLGGTAVVTVMSQKQSIWALWPKLSNVATVTFPGVAQSYPNWNIANNPGSQLLYDLSSAVRTSGQKCFDIAPAISAGDRDHYIWKQQSYTFDGTHETQSGNLAIKNSGMIDLSWF